MPSFIKTVFASIAILFAVFIPALAQRPNFQFSQMSIYNGLANNTVTDIIQDTKGFIWFATNNGLQRFDGLRFSTLRLQLNNKRSLPSDNVGKLMEDDEGNIWVACNSGVARINRFRQPPERIPVESLGEELIFQPTRIFQDSKKNIWLVTRPYGIFWYSAKEQRFVHANKILPKTNWKSFSMQEELATGNFWVGGDSGLAYIDTRRRQFYCYKNNPQNIPVLSNPKFYRSSVTGLKLDKAGVLWLNTFWSDYPRSTRTKYESFFYNTKNGQLTQFDPPRATNYDYASDNQNNLWLLGENIFSIKIGSQFATVPVERTNPYGLKANNVYCFMEDRDHNRWIGTNEGVFVFNPADNKVSRGSGFDDEKKPLNVTPQQYLELPNGRIWMATGGHGIMEYDMQFTPVRRWNFSSGADDGNYNMIWCMVRGRDNRVWLGCQSGRLIIYDPQTNQFTKLAPPEFDLRTVRTAAEDLNGNIWFGTENGLIVKYDIGTKRFIRYADASYPEKEVRGSINKVIVDDGNVLWACTAAAGVLKINTDNGKVIETFRHSENDRGSISTNATNSIIQYNDTSYVISSALGVNILNTNTKKFSYITTMDGLPSNTALSLTKDLANNIWVGLNGFIVRISMPAKKVVVLGLKDGVFNEVFRLNAMERLSDGRIVVGTTDDFIFFYPKKLQSSSAPPDVQITGFKVFNQEINIDSIQSAKKQIWLPFNQNFVRIEYSPLGFLDDDLIYYYKLEGVDKDWIRGAKDLSANYANLGAGTYTFLVRCENGDGIRSKKITSMSFMIRPPFWESWWFLVLLAAISAGVLYYFHRQRVNRIIAMEAVRSRIARDLHDDMGSTLSTIRILSEMSKMKIEKDMPATKSYINKIIDNSSRMMEAMDDIVWSINPMNDNMQKMTARMREYATNLLEAKDIEYSFEVDDAVKQVKLDMEARRDFFLIFKEAVNNLAKYSNCTYAQIKIEVYEYTMVMKIQDNGLGFNVKDADSGNGLSNMQKRAQNLNSKLNIDSQPGVGTKIVLEVNFA